jgi:4-carboxymuconolactone decarboxylase
VTEVLAKRGDAEAARRATEALTQALAALKGAGA